LTSSFFDKKIQYGAKKGVTINYFKTLLYCHFGVETTLNSYYNKQIVLGGCPYSTHETWSFYRTTFSCYYLH